MSRIDHGAAEQVEATPRRAMTPARRRRVAGRQHGLCGCGCGARLADDFEVDHALALWLGGSEEDTNLVALTKACHSRKTKVDAAKIFKVKRLQARESGTRRPRPKIKARGFERDPLSWRNA